MALGYRSAGFFAIARVTRWRAAGGTSAGSAGGSSMTCRSATSSADGAKNGGRPARQWYATAPSAYTSVAGVMVPPEACSGAM
jgi:hypothetical protein